MTVAQPYPNSWIWARGELWLVCPNGCCAQSLHQGGTLPPGWRYATKAEVDAHEHFVFFGVNISQQLLDMEPAGRLPC